jgi:tRNA splicing endonuclease
MPINSTAPLVQFSAIKFTYDYVLYTGDHFQITHATYSVNAI